MWGQEDKQSDGDSTRCGGGAVACVQSMKLGVWTLTPPPRPAGGPWLPELDLRLHLGRGSGHVPGGPRRMNE